jgi:glycerol-3-phosphate dehydrogenase
VWTCAGLRPLLAKSTDDPKSVTRDYVLELDRNGPPLLSVYGGKITTYRKLAQDVVDELAPGLGAHGSHWTASAQLPGGDVPGADFERFLASATARYPWLPAALLRRYARAYGTRVERLLGPARGMAGLGEQVLPGLYAAEVHHLCREEWAVRADDILWRRTKLGLGLPPDSAATLDRWLAGHREH